MVAMPDKTGSPKLDDAEAPPTMLEPQAAFMRLSRSDLG